MQNIITHFTKYSNSKKREIAHSYESRLYQYSFYRGNSTLYMILLFQIVNTILILTYDNQ